MKTRKLFRNLLIVPCLALAMTACKKNDPQFGFYTPQLYFVQQDHPAGSVYFPYIAVAPVNGELQQCVIKFNDMPLNGRSLVANTYETTFGANTLTTITGLSGTYSIEATSAKNEVAAQSAQFTISQDQQIGEMTVSDFTYSDGKVSAKIKAENANAYLFMVHPVTSTGTHIFDGQSSIHQTPSVGAEATATYTISSSYLQYDRITVSPIAVNIKPNTASVLKFGAPKTLEKDGTGWKEVTPEPAE